MMARGQVKGSEFREKGSILDFRFWVVDRHTIAD
jgi:hypothetical protein